MLEIKFWSLNFNTVKGPTVHLNLHFLRCLIRLPIMPAQHPHITHASHPRTCTHRHTNTRAHERARAHTHTQTDKHHLMPLCVALCELMGNKCTLALAQSLIHARKRRKLGRRESEIRRTLARERERKQEREEGSDARRQTDGTECRSSNENVKGDLV